MILKGYSSLNLISYLDHLKGYVTSWYLIHRLSLQTCFFVMLFVQSEHTVAFPTVLKDEKLFVTPSNDPA